MTKQLSLLLAFVLFISCTHAQVVKDSAILVKYQYDTLGFVSFPQAQLLDSIHPAAGFTKWEMNTFSMGEPYRNLYRFPATKKPLPDTVVLSKSTAGFGTFCPPGWCSWYISAQQKEKIITVNTLNELSNFLGVFDNKFDAYLWLSAQYLADSRGVPVTITPNSQYKAVKDGILIKINMRISDCPITHGTVMYFVGNDKRVVWLNMQVTSVSNACI